MYNVYRCQVHHNIYHTYGDTTNTLTLSIIEYLAAAENRILTSGNSKGTNNHFYSNGIL